MGASATLVVRYRWSTAGVREKEAVVIQMDRETIRGERCRGSLGLMGQNSSAAALLTAFDQHLPPGQNSLLPIGQTRTGRRLFRLAGSGRARDYALDTR